MTVEWIPIRQIWAFLKWFPHFTLRRKFDPKTLANLIYVDLRPRFDSATLNLGSSASFELWLQLINLSPFEVELDRGEFELRCGPLLKTAILKRQKLKPGEITSIRLYNVITDGQANEIKSNIADLLVSLEGYIDFNCTLHNFSKNIGHLEGIRPRLMNTH